MTREVPIPAAAVAFVRDTERGIEVYLNRRPAHFRYYPGAFVFPGGRRDEEDSDLQAAACREVKEEIGVEIEAANLVLLRQVHTNPKAGPVYDMHTYAYRIEAEFHTALNREEVDEELWISANAALEKLYLPYQISAAIYTISRFATVAELLQALANGSISDEYRLHKDYWL
ncbi:MAG: NUDIX domain-containing protein [Acidobacteria bacterium]|nr:NUDIX domain-containing protein [Acidobacteriota bacterium]